MHAIFITERNQFHSNQRVEREEAEMFSDFGFQYVGRGRKIIRAHFFACKNNMDRITGFGGRSIEENVQTRDMPINEASGCQSAFCTFEVRAADQQIDILCVAHCGLINAGNPGRHSVSVGDRVRNPIPIQGGSGTQQSFANDFHSPNHPFPGNFTICAKSHSGSDKIDDPIA